MPQPIPYLAFDGTCRQAMTFYAEALGGRLEVLMTNGESPIACHMPGADPARILHARLALPDGGLLMAGDCPQQMPFRGQHGVALTLNFDTVPPAQRAFAALAAGGAITMPLQATFWAKTWGMLVDRFGTAWIVNGELLPIGGDAANATR